MTISIIIPTLNEATHIGQLVEYLKKNANKDLREIIVADGGSTDGTPQLASTAGATTIIHCPEKGRSCQMNEGVEFSTGDILYFVHADSIPPPSYIHDIQKSVNENFPIGCFRFKFNSDKKLLKFNAYMTRFDKMYCRGGDQTLFVKRDLFEELNGYRKEYKIMEEYDFIERAKEKYPFKIIPKEVIVSARKYEGRSWFRVMLANSVVFNMYKLGVAQDTMIKTYQRMLS